MKITKAFSKFQPSTRRVVQKRRGARPILLAGASRPFFDGVVRLSDVTGLTGTRVTAHNRRKLRSAYGIRQAKHKRPMQVTHRRPVTARISIR